MKYKPILLCNSLTLSLSRTPHLLLSDLIISKEKKWLFWLCKWTVHLIFAWFMIEYWFYKISWMKINFNQLAKKKKISNNKTFNRGYFFKALFSSWIQFVVLLTFFSQSKIYIDISKILHHSTESLFFKRGTDSSWNNPKLIRKRDYFLLFICDGGKAIVTHPYFVFIPQRRNCGFFGTTFVTNSFATFSTVMLKV